MKLLPVFNFSSSELISFDYPDLDIGLDFNFYRLKFTSTSNISNSGTSIKDVKFFKRVTKK
ncbi:hypothetical protein HYP07_gp055 [Vibrio phage JSF3]|uniref:hypothetical protein n=1 Tax=Vibrio phage JSF3 TaxID=1916111 RepID=UPI000B5F5D04|nr:hypothetical protein HYP07_gp055 [Vibrio phage JSF3]APD18067.1 hypothetical protein [Vibrio phage JSF3]